MIIHNFEKHDWDEVQSTITDVNHLEAYKSILIEFKSLYTVTRAGNCDDQKVYDRLDELQMFLDSYRKAYKAH
jgi:hypothetical protein